MIAADPKTMKIVNMHEAKTHLSRLVEEAVQGKPFLIARAGKAMVKVEAIGEPEEPVLATHRFGFLKGQFTVSKHIKEIGRDEIEEMFGLKD